MINEIATYLEEDIVINDSVAVSWNGVKFINEGIIIKNTKLKIGELINIGGVSFPIKDIFHAMPGLHYINTQYGNFSLKNVDRNNWEQYKYYEKTRNN